MPRCGLALITRILRITFFDDCRGQRSTPRDKNESRVALPELPLQQSAHDPVVSPHLASFLYDCRIRPCTRTPHSVSTANRPTPKTTDGIICLQIAIFRFPVLLAGITSSYMGVHHVACTSSSQFLLQASIPRVQCRCATISIPQGPRMRFVSQAQIAMHR